MTTGDREIRLQIMLQPDELVAIEDWRFATRMPSRAAAVRELLRRAWQPRVSSWLSWESRPRPILSQLAWTQVEMSAKGSSTGNLRAG